MGDVLFVWLSASAHLSVSPPRGLGGRVRCTLGPQRCRRPARVARESAHDPKATPGRRPLAAGGQHAPSVRAAAEAADALRADGFHPPACALIRTAKVETLAITPVNSSVLLEWCYMPGSICFSRATPFPSSNHAGCFFIVLTLTCGLRPCAAFARFSPSVSGCAHVGARWTHLGRVRVPACLLPCARSGVLDITRQKRSMAPKFQFNNATGNCFVCGFFAANEGDSYC